MYQVLSSEKFKTLSFDQKHFFFSASIIFMQMFNMSVRYLQIVKEIL